MWGCPSKWMRNVVTQLHNEVLTHCLFGTQPQGHSVFFLKEDIQPDIFLVLLIAMHALNHIISWQFFSFNLVSFMHAMCHSHPDKMLVYAPKYYQAHVVCACLFSSTIFHLFVAAFRICEQGANWMAKQGWYSLYICCEFLTAPGFVVFHNCNNWRPDNLDQFESGLDVATLPFFTSHLWQWTLPLTCTPT